MNDRIVIDPRIQHGRPVIRGTRVPVARIVGGLAGGMTIAEVVDEYGVTDEDVRVALSYAAALVEEEVVYPQRPARRCISAGGLNIKIVEGAL